MRRTYGHASKYGTCELRLRAPDRHGHRPPTYGPFDFFGEYALLTQAYQNDTAIPVKNNLIAPSVSGTWTPEEVWNTGFVDSYTQYLGSLSVER